jgi:hypothetical protein
MTGPHVRRLLSGTDSTLSNGERTPAFRKSWAAAVVVDPFAGEAAGDLALFAALGERLGEELGRTALAALGKRKGAVSYGKGAIVGIGSDLERGAALLHPRFGGPLRALLGRGKAIIPSTIKQGAAGCALDVPLHGVDDEWDFALLDAQEITAPGAPLANEILVVVVLGHGGRAFARVGKDSL